MLALPILAAVPRTYTTAATSPLAAQLALELAGKGELPALRKIDDAPELRALERQLEDWIAPKLEGMKFIRPRVHLALNHDPNETGEAEDAYTLWIGNGDEDYLGTVWLMERRWRALEASQPGLAAAALNAIGHAGGHSFPVYTPGHALDWASSLYWHGETDERYALEEYRGMEGEDAPVPDEMVTRAQIDKALPPAVTMPRSQLKERDLHRCARTGRHGDNFDIARLVLAINAACKAAHRRDKEAARRKVNLDLQSQDENGFCAVGFACCLRWNQRDPRFRIFDDHGNYLAEDQGTSNEYGWIVGAGARQLPAILDALGHCFAIARLIEDLLPLVATRIRP